MTRRTADAPSRAAGWRRSACNESTVDTYPMNIEESDLSQPILDTADDHG